MSLKISTAAVDRAETGVWLDYPKGGRFLVASKSSRAYKRALFRDVGGAKQRDKEDLNKAELAIIKVVAAHILKGWEGVEIDGSEFEFTPDNSLKLLTAFGPWSAELMEWLSAQSQDLEVFEAQEEAAKAAALKSGD